MGDAQITSGGINMTIVEIEQNRNSLIDSLVKEENELLKKIEKSRSNDDYGLYKNLIRALTDVTTLKQRELANAPRYTWKDMYSHYYEGDKKINGENEYVATWKQNYMGDIKEHKIYKVEKEVLSVKVEIDKNYIIDGDTLTIPIKVNGKNSCSIKGKRVDDKWVLESGTTIKCN